MQKLNAWVEMFTQQGNDVKMDGTRYDDSEWQSIQWNQPIKNGKYP